MENKKNYVVKIQGYSDKMYKFKCQENTNGVFGASFDLELDAKYFDGLGFDEVKGIVQDYLNGKEIYEVEGGETPVHNLAKGVEINTITSGVRKYAIYAICGAVFVFGTILTITFSGSTTNAGDVTYSDMFTRDYKRMNAEQKVAYLEEKVKQLRQERETVDANCKAMCAADRQTYDGLVTQLLGEKSMLGLTIQEEAIARQHQR